MIILSVSKFLLSWIVFVPIIYFRPASFLKAVTRSVLQIFYNFHLSVTCASVLLKYLLNLTTLAYMLLILVYIFYYYVFVVEQLFSIKLVNFLNFLYYSIFFVTYLGHTFLQRVGRSDFALALTWVVGRYSGILQHSVTLYQRRSSQIWYSLLGSVSRYWAKLRPVYFRFRISGQQPLIKRPCHNSRTSDHIEIKLRPVTKLDNRNKTTSKKIDGVCRKIVALLPFFNLQRIRSNLAKKC